jgi:hypothetical protein
LNKRYFLLGQGKVPKWSVLSVTKSEAEECPNTGSFCQI